METTTVNVNVVDRSFEILPPNMPIVEKIGRMAAICYRTEIKEGEGEPLKSYERIIRACIKNGHESVLEHGAISVAIPVGPCRDSTALVEKITGAKGKRLNFRGIWESTITSNQSEYTIPFSDPDIETRHMKRLHIADQRQCPSTVPVVLADVRAWRAVIRGKMRAAIAKDDPFMLAITLAVAQAVSDVAPILFEDVIAEIEEFLAEDGADKNARIFVDFLNKREKTECSLRNTLAKFFDQPDDIFAEEASECAMFSVIITTDRATTHQLVRHRRLVGYSQESQRYVNYGKKGFEAIRFMIDPRFAKDIAVDANTGVVGSDTEAYKVWKKAMDDAFASYQKLLDLGVPPESARGVLPNDCKTTIGVSWLTPLGFNNFMHWRLDSHAQLAIRRLFQDILVQAICDGHPFTEIIAFDLTREWLTTIEQQGLFKSELDVTRLNTAKAIVEKNQKEADEWYRKLQEKQKLMEAEAKRQQEEALKTMGEQRAQQIKDQQPKVIDLGKAKDVPKVPPEEVHENAPTVQFIKGDAKPAEQAPEVEDLSKEPSVG